MLAPIGLLVALTAATFAPVLRGDFLNWDDTSTIAANPAFHPVSIHSITQLWLPRNAQMDLYVPVTYTWWGVLAALGPRHPPDEHGFTLAPATFHAGNLLLHAASA